MLSNVIEDGLGSLKGTTVKIHIDPEAKPKFHKARTVPHALKEKVGQELDRLEREHVIEQVQFLDWATPIVPIVKKDGSVQICGDYKTTINQAAKTDTYPHPRIEDIFMSLSGGTAFFFFKVGFGACVFAASSR